MWYIIIVIVADGSESIWHQDIWNLHDENRDMSFILTPANLVHPGVTGVTRDGTG